MKNLGESIFIWLESYKRNSVKEATYDRLITTHRTLCNHYISRVPPESLQTRDLQKYINDLTEAGYSQSTIKKQYHLLSAYITYANAEGIIPRPIHKNVNLPTQSNVMKKKREVDGYSKIEQIALLRELNTMKRTGYGVALLMLEAGLRIGEAVALTWDDVDWDRRAIKIHKTLIRLANKNQMKIQEGAKSHTSNRIVPLSTKAYAMLEGLVEKATDLHGYIFQDADGGPISYEAMRYQISKACENANVEYRGQHVFRHTFATNCYKNGADVKILSKLLGHSSVAITYNTYIHLYGDALEEMRSVVA